MEITRYQSIIKNSMRTLISSYKEPMGLEINLKLKKNIPENATIREEYVKCGNYNCHRCPHGPYYYAYWKDKDSGEKLQKKYIGTRDPREKEKTLIETLESSRYTIEDAFWTE